MLKSSNLPQWLDSLLKEKFFNPCGIHEDSKKNEKNIFCLDCCESICPHCLSLHTSHRLLQIRRYVYHDVIRLSDSEKLMDCGFVQSYTTNSAKVVFLNQRAQTRAFRGTSNTCINCYRALQHPFLFCSLSCKLQNIMSNGVGLSKYLHKCDHLTLPEPGLDEAQMTPDSVLEPAGSLRTSSSSSGGAGNNGGLGNLLACTAATEIVRKKRSVSALRTMGLTRNRRKGAPRRSPFF